MLKRLRYWYETRAIWISAGHGVGVKLMDGGVRFFAGYRHHWTLRLRR